MTPTATTALYAILGRPVQFSKSPNLHNAVFAHLGIDAVYVAHEPDDVGAAIQGMKELGYAGANLTMPFKSEALAYLDEISDVAKEMKAVKEGNCWSSGGAMYQRTDIAGDMILDFHTLFTSDDPESELNYITKLK